jgi:hypothetical protein
MLRPTVLRFVPTSTRASRVAASAATPRVTAALAAACLLLLPAGVAAQPAPALTPVPNVAGLAGIVNLQINGNQVTASLDLPGIQADLVIGFEQVVGLSAANLGLSAQLLALTDLTLLGRLPTGGLTNLVGAFPVLLKVQPPAAGGLSFSGDYTIEIHTYNLELLGASPLRLFAAPDGGAFQDITCYMGTGSYRVRGSRGTFSEFLILADLRALDTVIRQKFAAVNALLTTYGGQLPAPLLADLTQRIQQAQAAYQAGAAVTAAQAVAAFGDAVKSQSGTAIPDVWRAGGDLPNVAGQLRAAADTLRFSLGLVPSAPAPAAAPPSPPH